MSIKGYAEGLNRDIVKDVTQASEIILKQSEKMESLVEELLLISKIDSGQMKMEHVPLNICEVMDSVLIMNEATAREKGIRVEYDFSNKIPTIIGDEGQLYRALNNIFVNAVRYTSDWIKVNVDTNKKYVIVTIQDNGPGISEEDFPHIFERFYYGKNGGTGIGLSLALEIIQLHQGRIEISKGVGARFIVYLPIM